MAQKKWIMPYLIQYRKLVALSIFLSVITILFGGALMFTSGYLISKAATRPESILMVYVPIVGVRTFGIGRSALSYVSRLVSHSMILRILSSMRERLYKILEPQALFIRSRFRSGDILGLLADDIEHLQNFYLRTLFPAITSVLIYCALIVSIGLFSLPFAIMVAIFIGLLLFVSPVLSLLYTKSKVEKLKEGKNYLYQQYTDTVLGMKDWLLSGHYQGILADTLETEIRLQSLESKKQRILNWRDFMGQLIIAITVICSVYWANDLVMEGAMSPTLIAAIALAFLSLLESFIPISSAISDTTTYEDSRKRLQEIEFHNSNSTMEMETIEIVKPTELMISIQNLSFSYEKKKILENICLEINQGDTLAILGKSGAGKSTLLKLIYGAYTPDLGRVMINGTPATAIHESMPIVMSMISQKPYLFNTTIRNNIRLGKPNATDEEIVRVCQMVQLDEMIKRLPDGYDTNVQETGQRFSGGERQRIALARILLQDTPVVLLDEPTVGLDPITEAKLMKTIFETLHGKTIIWVTHHLAMVENMDRILFIEDGQIILDGPHERLLQTEARYRSLYVLDRPLALST